MIPDLLTARNGRIFDGTDLRDGVAARFEHGRLAALAPEADLPDEGVALDLGGDILSPGYIDLQVNGGGGVMFNDAPEPATLRRIAEAHRGLGVAGILPTLITDTPEITRAAIAAAVRAVDEGVPGIAGLHLEGPHLSVARKGAHDPALIRPMTGDDLAALCDAAGRLPALLVTVAPESVTPAQVATLAGAGVVVSLGHSDAAYETCMAHAAAGARAVTHLFNAMSQLGNRAPGLVGAALASGALSAGLIADGIHVHPATLRAAWDAKTGPGGIFLVSDAMAPAGTDLAAFTLNGRPITRADGRLTLADGTLAGADLDLTTAIRTCVGQAGLPLAEALRAATTRPATLIGRDHPLRLDTAIRIAPGIDAVRPAIAAA
ncbi:N-acetylglucosamine-6-phosphate deacetylase [Roseivivax isoporae]|uniref:N-acetylglucosamine-6-phosphate deacetylase n=1 Tax=Roseivivax isoporae LMG 25204 TaxID=1449351 RepID=X7F3M4_9RHOB|nr:N-acetylglucosamine-6-phosphate deacetylase [Roseivivax isoporae]ETX27348.1 N-acetylglucosamine-6-phosphate deacetylase [Roseivivax isoporae LMG 25204]